MKQIVLLSGKQGSGKTTLCNNLFRSYTKNGTFVRVINFADTIYEIHNFALGVLKRYGIERDIVKDGPLLQLLGTEWARKTISENIWVEITQNRIDQMYQQFKTLYTKQVFVVGDCRFKNELECIPEALRVRLECPKPVRKERCSAWRENDTHPSEIDLDDWVETGKFDMYFNTQTQTSEHCATMIAAQLDKNTWLEKRK